MIIYAEPRAASNIPVVDLARSFSGDRQALEAVAAEIRIAARDTGFFYVSNHGIAQSLVDGAFAQANRLFDLPEAEKLKLRKQASSNGYEPLETQRLDNASPGDLKESFNFAQPGVPGAPMTRRTSGRTTCPVSARRSKHITSRCWNWDCTFRA
jgi:isopenicillin N synthase-like dioxygenase